MTTRTHGGGRSYTEADKEFIKTFGKRVRAMRLELGLKQPIDLARRLELADNQAVGAIENGSYFPKPLVMMEIAAALGVSTSVLLGDNDPDGDWHAGYRAALADLEHAMHDSLKGLRQKGKQ